MSSKSKRSPASPKAVNNREEDYSIYIPLDGIRDTAPWRIGKYRGRGILTRQQKASLMADFGLPEELVRSLSKYLGNCLETGAAINLVEVNRRTAIKRGGEAVFEAEGKAKKMVLYIEGIAKALEPLENTLAETDADAHLLNSMPALIAQAAQAVSELNLAISKLAATPGATSLMTPLTTKKAADNRRKAIVETCCYIWLDAGRSLIGISQDWSKEGDRSRPLMQFIQTIVEWITDPSARLSEDTIRSDIKRFKKKLANPGSLDGPPEFGPVGSGNFVGNPIPELQSNRDGEDDDDAPDQSANLSTNK